MSALPQTQPPEFLIGMIHDPLSWEHWPAAKAMLNPALMLGDEDWPAIEASLQANNHQLWAIMEGGDLLAAAVTRIALARGGEVAEVFLIGGSDFPRWLPALDATIEAAARQIGCVAMRAYGREGWRKPIAALGWRVSSVSYEKLL